MTNNTETLATVYRIIAATTSGLPLVQIDALAQAIMADPDRLANLLAAFAA